MTAANPGTHRADVSDYARTPDAEVERLQSHIEETREDLARTVDQLATSIEAKARPAAAAAIGTVVGLVALALLVKWRRRSQR